MHGEYKIPGGKVVVVDVEAEDGVLRHVRVAGDFFLEPDEALDAVNRALEGAPADTDATGLAARIAVRRAPRARHGLDGLRPVPPALRPLAVCPPSWERISELSHRDWPGPMHPHLGHGPLHALWCGRQSLLAPSSLQ